jgi:hypothetical protein
MPCLVDATGAVCSGHGVCVNESGAVWGSGPQHCLCQSDWTGYGDTLAFATSDCQMSRTGFRVANAIAAFVSLCAFVLIVTRTVRRLRFEWSALTARRTAAATQSVRTGLALPSSNAEALWALAKQWPLRLMLLSVCCTALIPPLAIYRTVTGPEGSSIGIDPTASVLWLLARFFMTCGTNRPLSRACVV